jgi:hypothetical protein
MNIDVCIQIGNSDNKLLQDEWSKYCKRVLHLCEFYGIIHFSGGSAIDAPWQNYCVCLSTTEPLLLKMLKGEIEHCRKKFRQDSVAWLQGNVELV